MMTGRAADLGLAARFKDEPAAKVEDRRIDQSVCGGACSAREQKVAQRHGEPHPYITTAVWGHKKKHERS